MAERKAILRLTVKERILVHLSRYSNVPFESVNVPYELTQDGIGNVVGVSRAHVSLELRTLVTKGYVVCWKAHIQKCATRRFAYIPTALGIKETDKLVETFLKYGYDPEYLLDMKRCNPAEVWAALDEDDRDVLGIACLFKTPVQRSILPRTKIGAIPISPDGCISIPEATARIYISFADAERVRFWHSWIADYWDSKGDWPAAFVHYVLGRRMEQARRCLILHRNEVIGASDRETLRALKGIDDASMTPEFASALAEVAICQKEFKTARQAIDYLRGQGSPEYMTLQADLDLRKGSPETAASIVEEAYNNEGNVHAAATAAEVYAAVGRFEIASEYAKRAAELMTETGDTFDLDRIFTAQAVAAYNRKDYDTCLVMHRRSLENAPGCREGLRRKQLEKAELLLQKR